MPASAIMPGLSEVAPATLRPIIGDFDHNEKDAMKQGHNNDLRKSCTAVLMPIYGREISCL
jgi:hypothetical protein